MPTLFAALRHKDETVRRTARERLRLINEKDAKQITTRMAKEEEEKEVNSGSGGGGLGGGGGGGFF